MILATLLGCLPLPSVQTLTINLFRGSQVGSVRYWDVTDTYLDSASADAVNGGLFTLSGGKGRTILIRFGDLTRILPDRSKITKATLYLSPSSGEKPVLESVRRVRAPWGEGPTFTASFGRSEGTVVRGAATWKSRRNGEGGATWQQPGAAGPDDAAPVQGAAMTVGETEIGITGLAQAVQTMRDQWYDNEGFALTFSAGCEFFSSQAKAGKPRLEIEYGIDSSVAGADLSVQWIDRSPENPKNGEEVTYRAMIKNVGESAATPFEAQWIADEKAGARFPVTKALQPGESTIIETKRTFRESKSDHRNSKLMLRIWPGQGDKDASNDATGIYENALPVAVADETPANFDLAQQFLRTANETYFAQSRFSFAPDGVLERVRLVPNAQDAAYTFGLKFGSDERSAMRELLSQLTGLKSVEGAQSVVFDGRKVNFDDPYPGVSGFGDTRFEGLIPPGIPMLYAPVASPLFDNVVVEATDLLSATEASAINMAIGKSAKERLGVLWDQPATSILRAVDMTGKPLDGAELSFFQLEGGKMPDAPTQTIVTKEGGTVILQNQEIPSGVMDSEALHQLKKNPFGAIRADGTNGTILVRALINGEIEWGWLKAWQFVDAYHRGNRAAAIIEIRFNAPSGPLDRSTHLAKGRLAKNSADDLPAKLAGFTDGDPATEAELGPKPGDWIEIDLGRDRPIGEIALVFKKAEMPKQFDIQAYATGQSAPDRDTWVKDLNFDWTLSNRGIENSDGTVTIPYRGPLTRSRYIRIVNRSGGVGKVGEIRVTPLKAED